MEMSLATSELDVGFMGWQAFTVGVSEDASAL